MTDNKLAIQIKPFDVDIARINKHLELMPVDDPNRFLNLSAVAASDMTYQLHEYLTSVVIPEIARVLSEAIGENNRILARSSDMIRVAERLNRLDRQCADQLALINEQRREIMDLRKRVDDLAAMVLAKMQPPHVEVNNILPDKKPQAIAFDYARGTDTIIGAHPVPDES